MQVIQYREEGTEKYSCQTEARTEDRTIRERSDFFKNFYLFLFRLRKIFSLVLKNIDRIKYFALLNKCIQVEGKYINVKMCL